MAYVSKEDKAKLSPAIKSVLAKYGMKGSISVDNHSTLVVKLKSGALDLIGNAIKTHKDAGTSWGREPTEYNPGGYIDVNPYWFHEHFTGKAKSFLTELFAAMKGPGWFDDSDSQTQTDYFHLKHYVDVRIGAWDKSYEVTK